MVEIGGPEIKCPKCNVVMENRGGPMFCCLSDFCEHGKTNVADLKDGKEPSKLQRYIH
jgi:hypothetical protein